MPVALFGAIVGCAQMSTVSLDGDTIEIAVRVGTICDGRDAERLARRQAAVETIRRGFDDYVVVTSVGGEHVTDEARTTARTTLLGSGSRTLFSEDAPRLAHHRVLTVRMLQAGQGDSETSVSARALLGNDWEAVVAKGVPTTCVGIGG